MHRFFAFLFLAVILSAAGCKKSRSSSDVTLLNVSYDPTRELYDAYNREFIRFYKADQGIDVQVKMSHGGSGTQARSVLEGLEADVVTLALAYDIDMLQQRGALVPEGWQARLPNNSAPYTSTIVFVVRKGNPQQIHDWDDLVRPGVAVITPNPKTGGGARWNYLAAWGAALRKPGGNEATAKSYLRALFKNVPVLDSGARGATTTFAERNLGDVLLAWENEALLLRTGDGADRFEIVVPSTSILAEPPVALVDKMADHHGTRAVAEAYLRHLYTDEAQDLIATYHYRPSSAAVFAKHQKDFPHVDTFTVAEVFGGWQKAQHAHFDEGGSFDAIYESR